MKIVLDEVALERIAIFMKDRCDNFLRSPVEFGKHVTTESIKNLIITQGKEIK